ncbi:hypothetical protein HJC22_28570, partial [Corallococcus exiguus]|uniref:transposase n=2 Tax=Corallococcus TaxID=83461 RepID=UPI0014713BCD|nr:hypothetical protein [Corallococcus exiguus]
LDRASCHTAQKSQRLAARLGVHLVLLPKQRSELNCMDHLWRPSNSACRPTGSTRRWSSTSPLPSAG